MRSLIHYITRYWQPVSGRARVTHALNPVVALALLTPVAAPAQDFLVSGIELDTSSTEEQVQMAISAVETLEDVDSDTRTQVAGLLRDVQLQIQNRRTAETAAAEFAASITTAPEETDTLRAALDDPLPPPPTAESIGVSTETTLAELEQWLALEMADRAAVDSRLTAMQTESNVEASRPTVIRARIEQLRELIEEDDAAGSTAALPDNPTILTDARRLNAFFVRETRKAEIEKLEQESLSHSFRARLLEAQRNTSTRQRAIVNRRVELLRALVNERRKTVATDAQQATAAATLTTADKHPVVVDLAEGNAELTERLIENATQIQMLDRRLDQIEIETGDLNQRLVRSQQRLEIGGLSRVIGRLLIEERRNLPQLQVYQRQIDRRATQLAEVGLALVDIQEQRRDLALPDVRIENLTDSIADEVSDEEELATIEDDLRLLFRDRRDLLAEAERSYRSYLRVLGDMDLSQRRQLELVEKYRVFLDQNLIWIPSADIAFTGQWQDEMTAAAELLTPAVWATVTAEIVESVGEHVTAALLFLFLLIVLLLARRPLARRGELIVDRVGRLSTDHIGLTLSAVAIAAVRVAPVPLMVFAAAWFLKNSTDLPPHSMAIAESIEWLGPFLLNALWFRELSAPGGVFRIHFGWHNDNLAMLHRRLSLLIYIGAPLILITGTLFQSHGTGEHAMLGRGLFILLMIFLATIAHPLVHPRAQALALYFERNPGSWFSRLRWFWYALAVGSPILLAVLAILGYTYAAGNLAGSLVETVWLGLGLSVINLTILRWLALTRRKIAFQIALKKRESLRAEKDAELQGSPDVDPPLPEPEPLDLDKVDKQTKKLLRTGLLFVAVIAGWAIWSDILPAFNLLERIDLWSQTVTVDGVETVQPVTLADLLFAVLIVVFTAVAAGNLPGLMEVLIPRRLAHEPGSRYTITTLARYVVVMVGIVSVLNIVGWNWSQIQWLVAALSVGLGFGLQEIVANFVSGLVILFERPVRIGDTVTVGELTGTVSRVHIRATTITDWDRKEIIVPNKAFITEQVVNWTLSDPITRITIPVGVSYGSDVALTHKTMSETIRSLPLVLDEPPPMVYFSGFGDSALEFTLHVYLRQLNDRMPMIHEVHQAVFNALRKNGIEIPFPQRDLHIRSTVEHKDS